jgi:hypothetical protein
MDGIEKLPNCRLSSQNQFGKWFFDRGCTNYHDALYHIKGMPYGYPKDPEDPQALINEGLGTCFQKHAAAVHLAREHKLKVNTALGIYHLTEKIVNGVSFYLNSAGLSSIPAMHCFLISGSVQVDLTAGNCNGKNENISEFITYKIIDPDESITKKEDIWADAAKRYFEPILKGKITFEKVESIYNNIKFHMKSVVSCAIK